MSRGLAALDPGAFLPSLAAGPRAAAWLRRYAPITVLLAVSAFLRAFRLGALANSLIGDEAFYVQDARVILGMPLPDLKNLPAHPLSGLDPNAEHPPLAKLIMAGFGALFGDTPLAWRAPSVILGTLGILLLYLIVQRLGGRRRQAFFAAFLLAFDHLAFIQGRIAMLDVYFTTFILLGTWLWLRDDFELSGIAFALATLCKINGILGLAAVLLFDGGLALRERRWPSRAWILHRVSAVFCCAAFLVAGLGAMDNYFTTFTNPIQHLIHMVTYHSGLKSLGAATGAASTPLQWWLNRGAIDYFTWTETAGGFTDQIVFRAEMNPYLICAAPLALVIANRRSLEGSKLGAFALASLAGNFGPLLLAWAVVHRTSYIYYMLPSIPALACAVALAADDLPRTLRWAYGAAVIYAFFVAFPFRIL